MFRAPAPITGTGTRFEPSAPLDHAVRSRIAVVERLGMGDRENHDHVVVGRCERSVAMVVVSHGHRKLKKEAVRGCVDVLVRDSARGAAHDSILQIPRHRHPEVLRARLAQGGPNLSSAASAVPAEVMAQSLIAHFRVTFDWSI